MNPMNKTIIRISSLLLCVLMLLCTSACTNTNNTAPENKVTEEVTVQKEPVKAEGKRVYFASPMFAQAEKDFNLRVVTVLEEAGYEVFLPQRDGIEAALLEGKSEEELIEMIFALDHDEVLKADIVFMNLDGRVPDEGACVELGMAYVAGKRCYGFKTDTRSVEKNMDLNPLIAGCMIKIFKNYDGEKLIEEIKAYLAENDL